MIAEILLERKEQEEYQKKNNKNNKTANGAGELSYSRKSVLNLLLLDFVGQTRIMFKVSQLFRILTLLKQRSFNLLKSGCDFAIHRPQCYCLSRHLLAVTIFLTGGISCS